MHARTLPILLAASLCATAAPTATSAQESTPPTLASRIIPLGDSATNVAPAMSPDGRWIAATVGRPDGSASLWIVPAAGGTPVRVTNGNFRDRNPRWFPAGDRIVFVSNRASRAGASRDVVMVVSFDPRTGRATGTPRQLTLDAIRDPGPGMLVSPDGEWVSYVEAGSNRIKIVPASGGSARLVVEPAESPGNVTWSADGRHIYYSVQRPSAGGSVLMRAPVAGGAPEQVLRMATPFSVTHGARYLLVREEGAPGEPTVNIRLTDLQGRTVGRYAIDRRVNVGGFGLSADGSQLFGYRVDTAAWIRAMPLSGGPATTLTSPPEAYDWPLGWTPDSRSVVSYRTTNGMSSILVAPATGGSVRAVPLPAGADMRLSRLIGPHVLYMTPGATSGRFNYVAYDVTTGRSRTVVEDAAVISGFPLSGRGGRDEPAPDEFLYWVDRGESHELRASDLQGRTRPVRTFAKSRLTTGIGVHGSRVAYCEVVGDSARLLLAEGPNAAPRRLATLGVVRPDRARYCQRGFDFSNDGRWIAASYSSSQILLVDTRTTGAERPRLIDTGRTWWYEAKWLPDDSGFVINGELPAPTHLLHVPRNGGPLTVVTQADPSPKYGHYLSPDGRMVAYPAEVPQGSSIVILDLPAPLR